MRRRPRPCRPQSGTCPTTGAAPGTARSRRRRRPTRRWIESYACLGDALEGTSGDPATTWTTAAHALRAWALARPHEFQLIYGTPIPGYVAPPETVPLAERVAAPFMAASPDAVPTLIALAELVGLLTLEQGGHLVGGPDTPDALYERAVTDQVGRLGLG